MIKVKNGQDPYSVTGQYIRDHITAIEDMIAVIEINGKILNELFMVDMEVNGYFIWKSDWYEGEENVVLIDFFPVSDACNLKNRWNPCSERLPKKSGNYLVTIAFNIGGKEPVREVYKDYFSVLSQKWLYHGEDVKAWMTLPEPYKGDEHEDY